MLQNAIKRKASVVLMKEISSVLFDDDKAIMVLDAGCPTSMSDLQGKAIWVDPSLKARVINEVGQQIIVFEREIIEEKRIDFDINRSIMRNIQNATNPLEMSGVMALVEQNGSDRHLMNLCAIKDTSHYGNLPVMEWIHSLTWRKIENKWHGLVEMCPGVIILDNTPDEVELHRLYNLVNKHND